MAAMTTARPTQVGFLDTLGNTPLVRLDKVNPSDAVTLWGKLEQFNPGGSAKDRTAAALVEAAVANGTLSEGATLVESSSGNLGIALARQALVNGWGFRCVVDPRVNRATVAMMEALGATVEFVTEPDPETGDWLVARRKKVRDLVDSIPGAVNLDQYSNPAARRAHSEGTMREIVRDLGRAPDWLFVAVSTTGTIGGCADYAEAIGADTRIVGVDAEGSVLFGGKRGDRHLPGFGAGAVPDLSLSVKPARVDRIDDVSSVVGARVLAATEGILPGASGGAVITAALRAVEAMDPGSSAVLIFHDAGSAYLDTVYNDEWVQDTFGVAPQELQRRVDTVVAECAGPSQVVRN
ncbi:putative siderophore biosynthesis protein SbnA [Corynebacterium heidelbergense]|uniref:2,3-diaminopropionate biosynthesis protein SbnA n=2 Tax=Corynebacterium heidelbergense TaxID=2055947 RepID=A0A364VBL8_9CORY|nr:2,3-diaminopropionate biosynthesis protein SbnA [Corynebacterium heidelbergense]WCZ35634.1 putative siderophore biosynthesis protein SbnA [Corynebacterium heidelbergense]